MIQQLAAFLVFICFLLTPALSFSQETEEAEEIEEPAPPQRNILADAGYAALGIVVSNVFMNLSSRMGEQPFSNTTFSSVWHNISHNNWFWEDGDRFLVNQFLHPYHGSTYFASARINGFNFYESMLFAPLGSVMWEIALESEPSINDVISTTLGGIALGEMLHRIFLEVDSPSVWGTIGGFLVSPISGFNKVYNRPPRETGGGNIYEASVKTGVEKAFVFFRGHQEQADSWKYPGGHVNVNVVYGNPFVQKSKTPYEHFELYAGFTTNTASYQTAIISDGYLFSYNLTQTEKVSTSTGLTMHFDFFNATNDLINNLGYGNIQFSSTAIGWAVKRQYRFSPNSYVEMKAHAAFVLWGNTMYNDDDEEPYNISLDLKDSFGTYGMGENIKLLVTLFHNKAGKLEFTALGYHIAALPVNRRHSTGNVFFVYGSLDYCFPLGRKIGIGAKGHFRGLFSFYDSAENVSRVMATSSLYCRFTL
jgi:hypothetical protein